LMGGAPMLAECGMVFRSIDHPLRDELQHASEIVPGTRWSSTATLMAFMKCRLQTFSGCWSCRRGSGFHQAREIGAALLPLLLRRALFQENRAKRMPSRLHPAPRAEPSWAGAGAADW